jgi:inner membrane protein
MLRPLMDTLTHALSGALVARLICARSPGSSLVQPVPLAPSGRLAAAWDGGLDAIKPWQAVAVGLVAGAFPDIDSLTQLAGDMAYLQHHRGVTHSVLMAPLWALLIALVMRWCFADLRRLRGGWKGLYPIALAAIVLHIAGDWITQFGTMLLSPLSDHRFGLGAMFIIDLTFSGLLVAGLLLAALLPRARWPAGAGLLAASAWVGLAWVGQQEARALGEQQARALGIANPVVEVMPRPASPFNWTVMVSDGSVYHVAHLNTRRSEPLELREGDHFIRRFSAPFMPAAQAPWQQVPRFGGTEAPPWVREAWQHEAMATYRWFALAPALAQASEQVAADGTRERCAVFRDLRFEFPGRSEPPFRYGVCLRDNATQVGGARLVRLEDGTLAPV